MLGQNQTVQLRHGSEQEKHHLVANPAGESGTLLLDRLGRILSCGTLAESLFGASQVRLIGRRISELVRGLCFGSNSPSFSQRYLVYLCADSTWRQFEATDSNGNEFVLELNLARVASDNQEMFLLNVRRPEAAPRSHS